MVSSKRCEYQRKCDQAALYPSQFTSLIVDGADQSGYGLPHFNVAKRSSSWPQPEGETHWSLRAQCPQTHVSLRYDRRIRDRCNIIESLHRTLRAKSALKPLKGTLLLQVDNCTRENKNKFLFSYLEGLVAWGVLTELQESFLAITRTYSDIDQKFSCTSRRLASKNTVAMDDLVSELRTCFSLQTVVTRMLHVINFSGLCKQERVIGSVKPFSKCRYFRFHRTEGEPHCNIASYRTACSVKVFAKKSGSPSQLGTIPNRIPAANS